MWGNVREGDVCGRRGNAREGDSGRGGEVLSGM